MGFWLCEYNNFKSAMKPLEIPLLLLGIYRKQQMLYKYFYVKVYFHTSVEHFLCRF